MKAIVGLRYGPPEQLQLQEVERPVPGDDEVLIEVVAATINKADVQKAVLGIGGDTNTVDALWAQLDPKKRGQLDAGDFAVNAYLSKTVNTRLSSLQDAVEKKRIQMNDPALQGSGTILDSFTSGGGTVLDNFAGNGGNVLDLFA